MSAYEQSDSSLRELEQRGIAEEEYDSIAQAIESQYEQREMAAVISITFSAMCLEAFFYDYAAEHLGDSYTTEHLDRLDLPSKLLVIPRLVTGKETDKSGEGYGAVKKLSADRNFLVHFKSRGFTPERMHQASESHEKLNDRLREGMRNGVRAVELVMEELDRLHDCRHNYHLDKIR